MKIAGTQYAEKIIGTITALAMISMLVGSASAEVHERAGFYGKAGIGLGAPDSDVRGVDIDPGAGFAFAGGYNFTPWLAAEADLSVVAGAKTSSRFGAADGLDVTGVGFTIGAKAYPLGYIDSNFPSWFDPYAIFGIGGGQLDIENVGDDSSFLVRFAFGAEAMAWGNLGAYLQGGYDIATEDGVNGIGHLVVGAIYRFQ